MQSYNLKNSWYKKAYSIEQEQISTHLNPGRIMITPGAKNCCLKYEIDIIGLVNRHISGDWGNIDQQDKETNKNNLLNKNMIMSSYDIGKNRIWIITDPGWETTTILLPEEY